MRHLEGSHRFVIPLLAATALGLAGCADVSEAEGGPHDSEPVTIEAVDDSSGLSRLTLTESAAERLAIATEAVDVERLAHGSAGKQQYTVVPYSSLIYDPSGDTWVYVASEPLVFMREAVDVDFITKDTAALTTGPEQGAEVVSVGAAELYGAELGVDH